jgi:hypothetical protein
MTRTRKIQSAVGIVALVALGACGGGGHDDNAMAPAPAPAPADNTVPASALASSSAFADYVAGVAATSNDTAVPIVTGDVVAPASETDAPK